MFETNIRRRPSHPRRHSAIKNVPSAYSRNLTSKQLSTPTHQTLPLTAAGYKSLGLIASQNEQWKWNKKVVLSEPQLQCRKGTVVCDPVGVQEYLKGDFLEVRSAAYESESDFEQDSLWDQAKPTKLSRQSSKGGGTLSLSPSPNGTIKRTVIPLTGAQALDVEGGRKSSKSKDQQNPAYAKVHPLSPSTSGKKQHGSPMPPGSLSSPPTYYSSFASLTPTKPQGRENQYRDEQIPKLKPLTDEQHSFARTALNRYGEDFNAIHKDKSLNTNGISVRRVRSILSRYKLEEALIQCATA